MGSDGSIGLDELVALLAPTTPQRRARSELARSALDLRSEWPGALARSTTPSGRSRTPGRCPASWPGDPVCAGAPSVARSQRHASHRAPSKPTSPPQKIEGSLTRTDLAALLAPTLGQEKSEEIVLGSFQKLRFLARRSLDGGGARRARGARDIGGDRGHRVTVRQGLPPQCGGRRAERRDGARLSLPVTSVSTAATAEVAAATLKWPPPPLWKLRAPPPGA